MANSVDPDQTAPLGYMLFASILLFVCLFDFILYVPSTIFQL